MHSHQILTSARSQSALPNIGVKVKFKEWLVDDKGLSRSAWVLTISSILVNGCIGTKKAQSDSKHKPSSKPTELRISPARNVQSDPNDLERDKHKRFSEHDNSKKLESEPKPKPKDQSFRPCNYLKPGEPEQQSSQWILAQPSANTLVNDRENLVDERSTHDLAKLSSSEILGEMSYRNCSLFADHFLEILEKSLGRTIQSTFHHSPKFPEYFRVFPENFRILRRHAGIFIRDHWNQTITEQEFFERLRNSLYDDNLIDMNWDFDVEKFLNWARTHEQSNTFDPKAKTSIPHSFFEILDLNNLNATACNYFLYLDNQAQKECMKNHDLYKNCRDQEDFFLLITWTLLDLCGFSKIAVLERKEVSSEVSQKSELIVKLSEGCQEVFRLTAIMLKLELSRLVKKIQ